MKLDIPFTFEARLGKHVIQLLTALAINKKLALMHDCALYNMLRCHDMDSGELGHCGEGLGWHCWG